MNTHKVRLTSLAHGGGCGCKLAPSVLQELLADQPAAAMYKQLLVGTETSDDAAVWQVDDNTCIIATTDFFMPMVDDPFDFGRIAATNAISDVYAMGGQPVMALAILGMPLGKIPTEMVREILKGGAAVCASAGIPVAGGHSIDCPEPVYGLAVIGTCRPEQVRRNSGTRPGDAVILTKPVGVGIYSAAIKKNALAPEAYQEMIATTTLLNKVGAELAADQDVHAITDVTGFGVLGHGLEMARGSGLALAIEADAVPMLADAASLAQRGHVTGASHRNWASYGHDVVLPAALPDWKRHLLADPQTSGGLLVACSPEKAEAMLRTVQAAGCPGARIIGRAEAGTPVVRVIG
ncbi:selenide, water dikinase SelD [Enhydrobacter sp.]|jgi:selenide,water dikinase|uniref:selenide, water dikinase SelD n=1 Tax=Enhydrobacter sp. TaxID=1894999 RepID=UPI0026275030|nr:selenide, water dikinase SelD [Enhydrobacter sp.]WIM12648.1 MAG: Selenide,water dikinase [Enhydrobacter sp.]